MACFWVNSTGSEVRYRLWPGADLVDVDHFLAGPVLGLAFQLRGEVGIHAGAVSVGGRAIGFAGPHGAGKSTLAVGLSLLGYPLLTDDVLPLRYLNGSWHALHSLPRAKLWEDSLAALGQPLHGLKQVTSWVSKRRIPIGHAFGTVAAEQVPLGAFYLLDPRFDDTEIGVTELTGSDAVFELLANLLYA